MEGNAIEKMEWTVEIDLFVVVVVVVGNEVSSSLIPHLQGWRLKVRSRLYIPIVRENELWKEERRGGII